MKKKLLSPLVAAGVLAVGVAGPLMASDDAQAPAPSRAVRVAEASASTTAKTLTYFGVVTSTDASSLAFQQPGRVQERPVDVGQQVKAGDLIARLDARGYANAVAASRARVDELEVRREQLLRDVERTQRLQAAGAATTEELEKVSSGLATLEAGLAATKTQLAEASRTQSETTIRAPFDGVITAVFAGRGEVVGAGQPVVALVADADRLEVEIEVPEQTIGKVSIGQSVEVRFPLADVQSAKGTVVSRANASSARRLFAVRVQLDAHSGLLAGMSAEVHIDLPGEPAVSVPVESLVNAYGQSTQIFRIRDAVAERVEVDLIGLRGSQALLRPGAIEAREKVVVGGQSTLLPGESVQEVP